MPPPHRLKAHNADAGNANGTGTGGINGTGLENGTILLNITGNLTGIEYIFWLYFFEIKNLNLQVKIKKKKKPTF